MKIEQRNELAKQFVSNKLDLAASYIEADFTILGNYTRLSHTLKDLIPIKAMGFRGVVATAITGQYLNPAFDPLNNFYDCNPRSIFEQGIFYAFENRIPCGKSDPLNVAKNTNVLDEEWAKGKRPQSAAQAAVDYLRYIEQATDKEPIINFFFFKLLEYANSLSKIKINMPENNNWCNQLFASKITQFLLEYPESGTLPQLIISKLLNKVYEDSSTTVAGGNESVFGTNTTSKKPADIWLEKDGVPYNLFEITVKKIDYKRLDDCIQALNALNLLNLPISFICRLPTDTCSLNHVENRTLNYKGKTFNFIDISTFTYMLSALLSSNQINELLEDLQIFVQRIERPLKTKNGWVKIFN